jgi:hypothetical protein
MEAGASGNQKTWNQEGESYVAVVQNFAASRSRYTLFCGMTSRPGVAQAALPEVVFKGKGVRKPPRTPAGITVQWTDKGSYRTENVVHFIQHNLRHGEPITAKTPWRMLLLDKFSGHLAPEVRAAALAKKYVLLIVPGGLTPDVQVADTHLNKPLKAKYKEYEDAWVMMKRSEKVPLPTPGKEEQLRWALGAYQVLNFMDIAKGFKQNGLLLALDGAEDQG